MKGKDIFKDPTLDTLNDQFVEIYDKINRIVVSRMGAIQEASEDRELTEEEFDTLTRIQDVAFRAQECLEDASLLIAKLDVL